NAYFTYTDKGQPATIRNYRGLTRGAMFNENNVYAASGQRLSSIRTIRQGNNRLIAANRRYIGPFTFNADSLERVDFPGGYFDGAGKAHFMLTDWQGNVNMVVDAERRLEQHVTYYPYGEPHREPAGQRHLFAAKERDDFITSAYDFGPRRLFSPICLWGAPDRRASDYAHQSPYVFCGANPIAHKEVDGNWYIRVSTSPDRGAHPYGVLTLYSHDDVPLYKTVVKARGIGRIRNKQDNDTPEGVSKIIGWQPRDDKDKYGVNDILALYYLPNQEEGGNRNNMHLHGGRAEKREKYNELWGTQGCLRIHDDDIAEIKIITDYIESINPAEAAETVHVYDDLEDPVTYQMRELVKNSFFYSLKEIEIFNKSLK
ncbi:MAG: hypothetical protein NC418_06290, partial [Muribaculaceae bacterium]|nr:hypothetical protein [Muribaculaceae bacterium]